MSLFDYIMESVKDWKLEGLQDRPPFRRYQKKGPGRCTEGGAVLETWQDGWDGVEGHNHLAEFDKGGGNVEYLACGPVFRDAE